MSAEPIESPRFIRKTELRANEYRKNFHQIDRDVVEAVTSVEADQITPLMSKIYLRMVNAPNKYWEREGVLRFEAELREEKNVKAWAVLCEVLGVASATASKALAWMHEQGIIGYFSGKNGVGIRIFLNRAASSIGVRQAQGGKKILEFSPASSNNVRASQNEAAFNDSFAVRETSDSDRNPRAPQNGAPETEAGKEISPEPSKPHAFATQLSIQSRVEENSSGVISADEITEQIVREITPQIKAACAREHEHTREWFQSHALPKAIRVSQAAAYDVLRAHGVITEPRSRSKNSSRDNSEVVKQRCCEVELRRLTEEEITTYAQSCVALLITQGQSIERTLSEMSAEAGGFLLADDAPRVRAKAEALIRDSEAGS